MCLVDAGQDTKTGGHAARTGEETGQGTDKVSDLAAASSAVHKLLRRLAGMHGMMTSWWRISAGKSTGCSRVMRPDAVHPCRCSS